MSMMDLKVFLKHFLGEENKTKKKAFWKQTAGSFLIVQMKKWEPFPRKAQRSHVICRQKKKKERNIPAVSVYVVVCERKTYVCARKKKTVNENGQMWTRWFGVRTSNFLLGETVS